MAAYTVGMRVKVVSAGHIAPRSAIDRRGKQWTVTAVSAGHTFPIAVSFDDSDYMVFQPFELAQLLPPDDAADQFIARIRKLGSEPVNDAPKVTVREGK